MLRSKDEEKLAQVKIDISFVGFVWPVNDLLWIFFTSTVDLATEPAVRGNGKMVKLSFNWQITAAAPNVNMATTKTKQTEENNGGSTDMFDWHLLSSWIIQYGQHDGAVVQALDFEAVAPICVCVLTNLLALC